ncbi:MAG: sigma-54 interaction domain-containing protein [Planctomycetota bacterium]
MSSRYRLLGKSPVFLEAASKLERAANSDVPVLLYGESGTGKELAARAIHTKSARSNGPFVAVNLAALPPTLIEDELFGHESGAFTGATASRSGRFRRAHGGTLFLDEIGDVPSGVQVKLLRAIDEGAIEPLGAENEQSVDVRIIAATHRDLRALATRGNFRSDLLYRISVLPVELPPLRERAGDIELLAKHFACKERENLAICEFNDTGIQRLLTYSWPGNVRELENAVLRARALSTTHLLSEDDFNFLGEPRATRAQEIATLALRYGVTLAEMEQAIVEEAVRSCHGNEAEAARRLGLSRRAVEYRIAKTTKKSSDH